MAEENKKMPCAPDYEAYYEEYRDKYNCMCEKVHRIEEKLKEEHERNIILEAQMEVVRLICCIRPSSSQMSYEPLALFRSHG